MTDASTPEPMSDEPSSGVYESCDPAFLRQLQAASGMDDASLARIACLSPAQLRQLKTGGDSAFYSPAIKRQAYRRVLTVLGAAPPAEPEVTAASPVPPTPSQAIENIVALSERKEYLDPRPVVDTLRGLRAWVRLYRQPLAALVLLLGAVLLFFFNRPGTEVEDVAQVPASAPVVPPKPLAVEKVEAKVETPSVAPAEPVAAPAVAPVPVASAPAPAPALPQPPVAAVTATVATAATGCAYDASGKRVEVSPMTAQKEGLYVYVVSPTDTAICVVDGKRQATTLTLHAGEGRSVYGTSPWQLSGSDLSKLQIYFQGWRVSLPDEAHRQVTLVEKPL